jgi:hypothetical protein
MPMINVPVAEDFYNKADKLFFDSFISLMNNYLYDNSKVKRLLDLTTTDNFFIVNLLHQSNECYLKGKICETSPYLLISELRSNDFLDCFTIEAGKLFNILSKIEPDFVIDEDFKKIYEKNKKSRNINIHSSELDVEIIDFKELIKEFLITHSIFRPNKNFSSLLFHNIVNKFKKETNKQYDLYNKLHFIYMRVIFELLTNDENNKNSINAKILNILEMPKDFKKSSYRYFCYGCVNVTDMCLFDEIEPKISDFTTDKMFVFKTLYKKDTAFYSCFCCNNNFPISLFKEEPCIGCISTGGRKKTFHRHGHCLECNLNIDLPKHKAVINFLKYGFTKDKKNKNFKYFDENKLLNRGDDLDKLLRCDKNMCLKFSKSTSFVTNLVINQCTGYYLFYLMNLNNINQNFLYENEFKSQVYEQHKVKYTQNETFDFIDQHYEKLFKFIIDESGKKYNKKELKLIKENFDYVVIPSFCVFVTSYYKNII